MENNLIGSFSKIYLFFYVCIFLHVVCTSSAYGDQRKVLNSLELELEMIVGHQWEFGTSGSSVEGPVLLNTEPSLQPWAWVIFYKVKQACIAGSILL